MGASTSVFEYQLVVRYREIGIQIPRISGHGFRTLHGMHFFLFFFVLISST